MGYLTITLEELSLTIDRFVGNDHIRTRPQLSNLNRTAYGTLVVPGTAYELPHQWQGKALLNSAQFETWRLIWARAEYNKRTSGTNYRLTIDDTTRPFEEVGSRSREKVSGTTETTIDTVDPAMTVYFARFYGVLAEGEPNYDYQGSYTAVEFKIAEDGIFAAA
jgi:hypothetical protein